MSKLRNSFNNKIRELLMPSTALLFSLFWSSLVFAFTPDSQVSAQAQNTSQKNQIQKTMLIVGSEQDFPPFAKGMTDETAGGFTVELWKAIAAEAGLNYHIRVLPFNQLLDEFKAGKIDVLINLNITDEAHVFADFSVPHAVFTGGIFVRNNVSNINSEADLKGKSIIMMKDDVESIYATSRGWDKQLVLVDTAAEGLRLLDSGKHDAMLINKIVGLQTLRALKLTNIKALKAKAGFTQKFAFAVHKGQSELLAKINESLVLAKANNTYDNIYQKWLGVYQDKEVHVQDVLKYIIPIAFIFVVALAYIFYRRRAEQIHANNEIQKREIQIKSLVGSIPDLIWLKDINGVFLNCNPMFEKLLGAKEADIVGKTDYDFVDKDLADFFRKNDKTVINARKPSTNEEWLTFATDGYHGLFETIKTPMYDANGELIGVLGVARDITVRHALESQTQLINERSQHLLKLESLFENLTEKEFMQHGLELAENITGSQIAFIHFVKNDEETIELVAWSRRTIEHYCHAAFDSPYPVSQAGIWADALRNKQPVVFNDYATYPHKRGLPDGHSPLQRLISVPVIENGKVVMLTSVGNKETDYTETDVESVQLISNDIWRLVQRRRTEKDQLIAATVFESQEGMMVTDANMIILRVNHAFTKITGYTAEDAVGQTPRILSSGRQSKEFYAAMWQSINNTGAWEGEIWNRRKSGEIYPEQLTITAVRNETGAVTNYVATLVDITMSKAASEEIKSLAFFDPLTQLPNRRLFSDRLSQALAASARSGQRGALLFLDLDHFKTLNDTLGHDVGDLLLQQVATRLTSIVREGDTVARFGGDEFVVLLEDLSEEKVEAAAQTKFVAEEIMLALNHPYELHTHAHRSTPSIGATLFHGHEQASEELLKQADIAMYQSKTEGRNTLRFFDPKMQEAIAARVDMENELFHAIELQQFQLHYQVQMGSSGKPLGAEALIRWLHPERGMISPFNFIPLAEDTGLILPIGQWVIDAACAQLEIWQKDSLAHDLVLSVNVSATQLFQVDFVEQVQAAIIRHNVKASRLKLELTESMLLDNIDDIIIKMSSLSKLGVRFSLDDFGTGYSSLQYLKRLPLDQLKIDQSFVRDIVTDSNDRAIVRTIITMASNLGINVIAEGVETEEQRQYLLDNGCTDYQGYLFSKPVPIDEFESLLRKG